MSSDDARRFREEQRKSARRGTQSQRRETPRQTNSRQTRSRQESSRPAGARIQNVRLANARQEPRGGTDVIEFPGSVYTAPAGTAYEANKKTKRMSPKILKLAALLLAAAIGLGNINVIGNISKGTDRGDTAQTLTQLENQGVNIDDIGLEKDTVELMERYDEYFANFDPDTVTELTNDDVIAMAEDIRTLNFNTIKDKVAELRGVSRDDVTLRYSFEKGDGEYHTSVRIHEDEYDREIYTNPNGLIFGIGRENSIPKEISDLIVQTGEYDDIITQLKEGRITKRNAIIELRKLYMTISENVAVKDFTMDDNGNIELRDYSEQTKDQKQQENGEER